MADLILFNANIITLDTRLLKAEAIVIKENRIQYTGSSQKALKYIESNTNVIDLKGKTVIPGFNDNHVHALSLGYFSSQTNLYGKNCSQIIDILKKTHANTKPGKIITALAWDYSNCPHPSKEILDRAFPRNPVLLKQYSGHAFWVNSLMLKKLRINKHTPDHAGGKILHDASGEPTGIIRGTIIYKYHRKTLIKRVINTRLHKKALKRAIAKFNFAGVTSVQDNTWQPFTVMLLNRLKKHRELTLRFSCWPSGNYKIMAHTMRLCSYDKYWIRKGPWKYIADGAFSPRSAWMMEPYYAEPENSGKPVIKPERLMQIIKKAALKKRQVAFHAIGDRTIHEILNIIEKLTPKYPWISNMRIRLEHAQIIQPSDIPRIKRLGILVAAQPTALSQPGKDYSILGPERINLTYPYKSLLKAGIPLSFGSDIPGETEYNPLLAIQYAVTRKGQSNSKLSYDLNQKITPLEALCCYTIGSAYAEFMEQHKGSISPGKLADLAVLSEDPTKVQEDRIKNIKVVMTIVGGRIVHTEL